MKRSVISRYLVFAIILTSCKTTSSSKTKNTVPAMGRKKMLFEGYNDNSRQYTNRICIAPKFALSEKTLRPEYLMPEVFALLPESDIGKIVAAIKESTTALGLDINPLKINTFSGSDQEASIEYIKDASSTTLLDKVAGGLNVNMNFAGGSASGGAQVALENGKTARSLSQMFLLKLRGQSVQVDPATAGAAWGLTAYGEQVKQSVDRIPTQEGKLQYISQHCGTSFISQVQFGAVYLASLKLIGKMESDLNYIQGQLNVKTVGASGEGKVEIDNKKISSDVKVNLSIYQKGGEPVSLAGILGGQGTDENGAASDLIKNSAASKLVNCDVATLNNCLDVFFKLVEYGTAGVPLDVNTEKTGTAVAVSPKLSRQISDLTRSGYAVTGYETERYKVEDFVSAGMLPEGMQLQAKARPNQNLRLNQPAKNLLPLSEKTLQLGLEGKLRSLIDIWAYARESRQVVNNLENRLSLANVESELLQSISKIQAVFEKCGTGDVTSCSEEIKKTTETMSDPTNTIAFIGEVNKIIEEELKTANFYEYCMLTGLRRFQDNQETDWRNSMQLLATRLLSPDIKIEGQSILTWRLDGNNAQKIIEAQKSGGSLDEVQSKALTQLESFCKSLYNAPSTTYLDFTYTGNENKGLLVEPLKYFKNIQKLTITGGSTSSDIVNNLAMLPDLRELTIRKAIIANPLGLSQMPLLQVLTLEGVQTSQGFNSGNETYLASAVREALRNRNLTRITIKQNPEAPVDSVINLEDFPLIADKGGFDTRLMFKVAIQSDDKIALDNVERFFGYVVENDACVEKYKMPKFIRWAGKDELELDVGRWGLMGCFSPCLDQVKARCGQFKKLSPKSVNLSCEINCGE